MEEKQFCRFCGESIAKDAIICPKCGRSLGNRYQTLKMKVGDSESKGFTILGCIFPFVAYILYLLWKDDRPLRAGSCKEGAIIGFKIWGVLIAIRLLFWLITGCVLASSSI